MKRPRPSLVRAVLKPVKLLDQRDLAERLARKKDSFFLDRRERKHLNSTK